MFLFDSDVSGESVRVGRACKAAAAGVLVIGSLSAGETGGAVDGSDDHPEYGAAVTDGYNGYSVAAIVVAGIVVAAIVVAGIVVAAIVVAGIVVVAIVVVGIVVAGTVVAGNVVAGADVSAGALVSN